MVGWNSNPRLPKCYAISGVFGRPAMWRHGSPQNAVKFHKVIHGDCSFFTSWLSTPCTVTTWCRQHRNMRRKVCWVSAPTWIPLFTLCQDLLRAVTAQSVQRWATDWKIGVLGLDSRRGLGIFLFTTASRTALGPTQPPIQCVSGALSQGVKWPENEADHSPPSSAEVKEWVKLYLHSPIRLNGVVLS
jgi:hypothetical protein